MKRAILKTFLYADIFDFPLTSREIWQRLIWQEKKLPNKVIFEKTLAELVDQGVIKKKRIFYCLPEREQLISVREKRKDYSLAKKTLARKISRWLFIIPTVQLIGLTGSVAAQNAKRGDDIDLLIIASPGWLWTTRFWVTIMASLVGKRRKPKQIKVTDKICLNLFVDRGCLQALANDQNLFVAYELLQLVPLWQRNNCYYDLLKHHRWIKDFLPNENLLATSFSFKDGNRKQKVGPVQKIIETFFFRFQLKLMEKKKTKEITTNHLIAFHPRSKKNIILKNFEERISTY